MPDPRPINSASWKAEAAQKVRFLFTRTDAAEEQTTNA
jgi:hypothetical protein